MEDNFSTPQPARHEPSPSTTRLPQSRIAAHGGLAVAALVLAAFVLLGLKTPHSATSASQQTSIQAAAQSPVMQTPTSTAEIPKDIAEALHSITSEAHAAVETADLLTAVPPTRSSTREGLAEGDWPREVGEFRLVRHVSHEHRGHYSHVDHPTAPAFVVRNRPGNIDMMLKVYPPQPGSEMRHVGDALCYHPETNLPDEDSACVYERGKKLHHIIGVGDNAQIDRIADFMQQLRQAYAATS